MKVACIGEAMIELTMPKDGGGQADVGVAGDTLNTAIYLKRTAPALQVDYITRLGADMFSDRIKAFIAAQDVGTDGIEVDPDGTPGLYAITVDDAGERSFSYWRSAAAARGMFATKTGADFSVLEGYDVIYLSGISLAILPNVMCTAFQNWLRGFRGRGGQVVYDSNYRPKLWSDVGTAITANDAMWQITDIALPSVDDEAALRGETDAAVAARFLAMGKVGALKQGPSGPLCLQTGTQHSFAAASHVVDTTAAGDSFNGGYLGALLSGADQVDALRSGHDLAARVVGHKGAILPSPSASG